MNRTRATILSLAGSILFASSTMSHATDLDKVNAWITKPPAPWKACPPVTNFPPNPANPAFAFNNAKLNNVAPLGRCGQAGPFVWHPVLKPTQYWWVQVISNLRPNACNNNSCLLDLVRVCSLAYVGKAPVPGDGPCAATKGVGPGGCEVCAVPAP